MKFLTCVEKSVAQAGDLHIPPLDRCPEWYTVFTMNRKMQSGYIGLLALLLSAAIMLFLFVKIYFTPTHDTSSAAAEFQPNTASGTVPTTGYERMHADVDAANSVANQLKARNEETTRVANGGE